MSKLSDKMKSLSAKNNGGISDLAKLHQDMYFHHNTKEQAFKDLAAKSSGKVKSGYKTAENFHKAYKDHHAKKYTEEMSKK